MKRHASRIAEFAAGLLFGLGLIASGMTDPGKVVGFLDLAGLWDPSLAFVMGGAIAVGLVAFTAARRRTTNFLGGAMHLPTRRDIDRRLLTGSLVFGAGWGLAGFCPGPALVALGMGHWQALVFVAAMLGGMALHDLALAPAAPRQRREPATDH
ncbi:MULTISPECIES: YeeE/YedE family protein [Ramlibacter]|uniref:YeeE/YedE family protein n=1 Tax=Ramlibacter aquaticus TaxID=2780094 RepID=A0ABR9SH07_9BURK|nr:MULTISPECIES: YeeE/YedE family protein [Ramlibacter]MBE7941555.1 YeeE/YedE family protein [Ramlibacter aquaticus]